MGPSNAYLIWMAGSSLIAAGMHWLISSSLRKRAFSVLLTWALGIALGIAGAKLLYIAAKVLEHLMSTSLATFSLRSELWTADMYTFLLFGGAAGVCLAVLLAGKLTGNKPMDALNVFAPAGALMAALARFGEGFLGSVGCGKVIESRGLCFFPLAVTNGYESRWAIFFLEGIACLIVLAVSLWRFRDRRFVRTLFYLCLPLILLESLRDDVMTVHEFVKVEQLLSMVVVEAVLIYYGVRGKGKTRFLPAVMGLLMAGLFVAAEYAIQGKLFNGSPALSPDWEEGLLPRVLAEEEDFWDYGEEWAGEAGCRDNLVKILSYCVMALGLGVLSWMEILGHRGIDKELKS